MMLKKQKQPKSYQIDVTETCEVKIPDGDSSVELLDYLAKVPSCVLP